MKKIRTLLTGLTFLATLGSTAQAQIKLEHVMEFTQPITYLTVEPGYDVRILPSGNDSNYVNLIYYCTELIQEQNTLHVFERENNWLKIKRNTNLLKSTVVEVCLAHPDKLHSIYVNDSAQLTIEHIEFAADCEIFIEQDALVKGGTWRQNNNSKTGDGLFVNLSPYARLELDSLLTKKLEVRMFDHSHISYNHLESQDALFRRHATAEGGPLTSDESRHIEVKKMNGYVNYFENHNQLSINFGVSFGNIPLFNSARHGSPYNIGQTYGIQMNAQLKDIPLANHWSLHRALNVNVQWADLLSSVKAENGTLQQAFYPGQSVVQHMRSTSIGLKFMLNYSLIGRRPASPLPDATPQSGKWIKNLKVGFGLMPMYVTENKLITRTLDDNNHWKIGREKVDVLNPFQVRALFKFSPYIPLLGRYSVDLYVDLLPTYKRGIGMDGFHQMGITLNF